MLRKSLILPLLGLLGCGDSHQGWLLSDNGEFYYQRFSQNSQNPRFEFGDKACYWYSLEHNGQLLQSSFGKKEDTLSIAPRDYRNLIEEAFTYAAEGDSLRLKFRYKQLEIYLVEYQNQLGGNDWLILNFKIRQRIPKSAVENAENQQYMNSRKFQNTAEMNAEKQYLKAQKQLWQTAFLTHTQQDLSPKLPTIQQPLINTVQNPKKPQLGDTVAVYYLLATCPQGEIFDGNLDTQDRLLFTLGENNQLLQGFNLAVANLSEGEAAHFYISADLGYGAAGSLPIVQPNQALSAFIYLPKIYPKR